MSWVFVLLALALGPGLARCATAGSPLRPDDAFTAPDTNGTTIVAPSVGWGNLTVVRTLDTPNAEECAAACREDPVCLLFDHCQVQDGCNGTLPFLVYQECRMLAMPCVAYPIVGSVSSWIKRTAGFPVLYPVPAAEGYVAEQAEGIAGSNLVCAGSVLPGMCAFDTTQAAVAACDAQPDCRTVVVYYRGIDGCSTPVSVLSSSGLFGSSDSFMSPLVASLTKNNSSGSPDNSTGGSGLSAGAIAGIVAGGVAVAAAALGAGWVVWRRRQQRPPVVLSPGGAKASDEEVGAVAEKDFTSTSTGCCCCTSTSTVFTSGGGTRSAQTSGALTSGVLTSGALFSGALTSGALTSGGGTASATGGSGGSGGTSGANVGPGGSSSGGGAGGLQDGMLPELAQHIEACDAQSSLRVGVELPTPLSSQPSRLSADSLSTSLRDWVVDLSEVTFMRRPDGGLHDLGCGASSTVYKASFRGEVVAAKQVDLGRSPSAQAAFVLEAERLHVLRHAYIVTLYGVALCGTTGVLLMEYCGGRDLMKALELKASGSQDRLFSWYQRGRRIAYDIAKALNFLHAKGVVHMDVKSSNVLLTGTGTAKLADIGLARIQHGTYLSHMSLPVGTFAWIAPEVLMGGTNCTSAVDIYSFGVVLWEIITGLKPSRGNLRNPVVPDECPQAAADLMMECLSTQPELRPTAQQVMQRLRGLSGSKADG